MVIIDAMPHRHVRPDLTPHLWRQTTAGGRAPTGGRSLPVSVTYANHAALVTGAHPQDTGIHGNHVWDPERGWVPAPKEGPRAPTLFDDVAAAGGSSAFVVGDHKLVHQMGGTTADHCWPPDGWIPDGTERCEFGYVADAGVLAALDDVDRCGGLDTDLVVVHLNQPDTTSHLYGPDSPEALEQYRATDAAYGQVIDRLADGWDRTLLVTVSDHDQETITDLDPVELAAALADLDGVDVVDEGTAALVHVATGAATSGGDTVIDRVRAVPGMEGIERLPDRTAHTGDIWMAWTEPGRSFGATPIPIHGQHGSPRCRTQLAIVSGGHPEVSPLATRVADSVPSVLDWAPMIRTWLAPTPRRQEAS